MKQAYVTVLSSEDFVPGVINTFKGIRKYSDIPFVTFVDTDISDDIINKLISCGIDARKTEAPSINPEYINSRQAVDRWNKTLYKLVVFKPQGYDKLVYLDSDLLIRGSLDELFSRENLSAVSDIDFYPGYGRNGLNAGVMVIEPSELLYERLVAAVADVSKTQEIFGDQDIINYCTPDWDKANNLHLNVKYNTCFYDTSTCDNPLAVHFILSGKPWMWSGLQRLMKISKWLITGKIRQIKYLCEYRALERLK